VALRSSPGATALQALLAMVEGTTEAAARAALGAEFGDFVALDPGRTEQAWIGNVVALGDAAATSSRSPGSTSTRPPPARAAARAAPRPRSRPARARRVQPPRRPDGRPRVRPARRALRRARRGASAARSNARPSSRSRSTSFTDAAASVLRGIAAAGRRKTRRSSRRSAISPASARCRFLPTRAKAKPLARRSRPMSAAALRSLPPYSAWMRQMMSALSGSSGAARLAGDY
jgi:hypothetical protein